MAKVSMETKTDDKGRIIYDKKTIVMERNYYYSTNLGKNNDLHRVTEWVDNNGIVRYDVTGHGWYIYNTRVMLYARNKADLFVEDEGILMVSTGATTGNFIISNLEANDSDLADDFVLRVKKMLKELRAAGYSEGLINKMVGRLDGTKLKYLDPKSKTRVLVFDMEKMKTVFRDVDDSK